jgi:uridine kinase
MKNKISKLLEKKNSADRIIIGIAGGSGSGKSTVSDLIKKGLHPHPAELVALDRFFKPVEELPTYWSAYHGSDRPNFNRPDSLKVDEMVSFCRKMSGHKIFLLEGHFALYYPGMRELMDIKCFVDIDIAEMLRRRTERNIANNYGGGPEEIFHYNKECVVPEYHSHILPTRAHADILIPNDTASRAERDAIIDALCASVSRIFGTA